MFTTKTEFERVRARDGKGKSDPAEMFSDDLSDKGLLSKIDKEHKLKKKREKKETNNHSEKMAQRHLSKEYTNNK